jgi:hypothetical protein
MPRRPLGAAALALSALLVAVPAAAIDSDSGVDVTDPGDEPRSELRYDWSVGLTGTTITQAEGSVTTMLNGVPAEDEQATLEMAVSRTVTEVDEAGNARIEFGVQAPERDGPRVEIPAAEMLPGDAADVLWAELAGLSAYSGWLLLDPRGQLLDYDVEGISDAVAEFVVGTRGLAGQVTVLPEEPVGVGATWETYTEVYEASLTFESEAVTTLVAMDGPTLTLEEERSVLQEPDLGVLEQVATTAGAIYSSQQLEGSWSTELPLDGLVETGTGEAALTVVAGAAVTSTGEEVQTDLQLEVTATAGE